MFSRLDSQFYQPETPAYLPLAIPFDQLLSVKCLMYTSNTTWGLCTASTQRMGEAGVSPSLDRYLAAVQKFHQSVSELASKLEDINNARAEVAQASLELREELDATERQMEKITAAVRQQISAEISKKVA